MIQIFTRADVKPGRAMWCERQYPEVQPGVPHPCPYDYFDGTAWRPGMPYKHSQWRIKKGDIGVIYLKNAVAKNLPWRSIAVRFVPVFPPIEE